MFSVLLNERPDPRFDAKIDGILEDADGKLTPNIFGVGQKLSVRNYAPPFRIKENGKYSEIGKNRDVLRVTVNNNDDLFVVSNQLRELLEKNTNRQVTFFDCVIHHLGNEIRGYSIVKTLNIMVGSDNTLMVKKLFINKVR